MREVMAIDPVCHMPLDDRHVKESLLHEGRVYYFCSVGCRAEFERHVEDYVQKTVDGVNKDV